MNLSIHSICTEMDAHLENNKQMFILAMKSHKNTKKLLIDYFCNKLKRKKNIGSGLKQHNKDVHHESFLD